MTVFDNGGTGCPVVSVGGVQISAASDIDYALTYTFYVPTGKTYLVTSVGATLKSWSELY